MRRIDGQKSGSLEAFKAGLPAALSVILTGREQHYAELSHSLVPELECTAGVVYSTYSYSTASASLLASGSPYAANPAHSSCRSRSGSLIRAFMKKPPLRFREGNHSPDSIVIFPPSQSSFLYLKNAAEMSMEAMASSKEGQR